MLQAKKYLSFAYKVTLANFRILKNPYKIFLVVTKSCGSRCSNCLIWKETPNNELTLEEYEKLACSLGKGLSWLNISGGEPTDRLDLIEIIKIFEKYCPNLCILNFTSNGLNPEKLIEAAKYLEQSKIPLIGINVSIDGPEEVHLKLRGGSDSYQKAVSAFASLRKFKKINVHASMTLFEQNAHLTKENFLQLKKQIPDLLEKEIHINYAFQSDHYYQNSKRSNWNKAVLPQQIMTGLSLNPFTMIKRRYLKHLEKFIQTQKNPLPCSSMRSNVYISEKGELYPCTIWNEKIGSLREINFDIVKILNTDQSKKLKKQISKNECPNCWSPCEAFPSIIDNIKGF